MNILVVTCRNHSASNRGIDVIIDFLIDSGHNVTVYIYPVSFTTRQFATNPQNNHLYARYAPVNYYEKVFGSLSYGMSKRLFDRIYEKTNVVDFNEFDLVILESTPCVSLIDKIPSSVPIVYRDSDPLSGWDGKNQRSRNSYLLDCEDRVIARSLLTLVPNESIGSWLTHRGFSRVACWKNGFRVSEVAQPPFPERDEFPLRCIYMGLFPIDKELVTRLAATYPKLCIDIVGPHKEEIHAGNVIYHGYLNQDKYSVLFRRASFAILPYDHRCNFEFGPTSKVYEYLAFSLPIVSVYSSEMEDFTRLCSDVHVARDLDDFVGIVGKLINDAPCFVGDFDISLFTAEARMTELDCLLNTWVWPYVKCNTG